MDPPVSAYFMYKAAKIAKAQKNRDKKLQKKKNKQLAAISEPKNKVKLTETTEKIVAEKLKKKQQKFKEKANDLGKRKTHKKKKAKEIKERTKSAKKAVEKSVEVTRETSEEKEEIPLLVPAKILLNHHDDDACSHSSSGSFEFIPVTDDSREKGLKVFAWMIAPYNEEEFLNQVWEKKPLHISRQKPAYYKSLISTPIIDKMLRTENIQFTKNIDVTSYVDGKRETHNPEGRAHPHLVWDFYLNGCSVRLLNPQTYIPKLHSMNATLQEFFHSFVGANAYLTPPESQGFAPHYDDIEAFILQIEGRKHWRIYKPLNENEVLPRFSSRNFEQEEIGEPIMEITLEAGDMLYFPRGYIHQGVTIDGEHSLHLTISMYQKHSWADLLEKLIPAALHLAINENVELRKGLPFDLYDEFGLVHCDARTPRREEIKKLVFDLVDKIKYFMPMDNAVDQLSKNYQHAALPPVLSDLEKAVTVHGDTDVMIENGVVINRVEMSLDTRIRLLRKNILRMVSEDKIRLYYHAENSLEYHGNELSFLEISDEVAPAIETLILTYPEYVSVENLDLPNEADKIQIADALWSRGLIMTEYPMETVDDE